MTAPAIPGGRYLRGAQGPSPDREVTGRGPLAGRLQGGGLRAWPAASGRWFLLVWLLALIVFTVNDPGRMIFDTKLGVDIDAAGFYARLWPLWNPLEWFGTLQNQYIGYAVPMGPFFLAGQALRIPVWVIERLWLSLLVAAGYWGLARLATALRIGSNGSRLLAGIAFALWPTFTIVIGSTSAAALPGLLAPWAVLPLVTALRERRSLVVASARSGVAVLLMGGVNAVSTICALALPALYILTHARGRRLVKAGLCWTVAVAAATAWWAGPLLLQGRYSFNFLPYVEQAATTTKTMSAAAFLRGTGNWTAYLDLGTPWLSAGWAMVATPAAIAASAVATAAGLYGLARRDMPEQLWLRLAVGLAALVALTGYPGPFGGPLHGVADTLLNGTLAPFRNISKLEPVVAVALALGLAHLLARAGQRTVSGLGRSRSVAAGIVLAPVIATGLAGLGLPYLTGQILQPGSFTSVPGYWSAVAGFLAAHSPRQTALVIPGASHGIYLWGDPIDDPIEPLARSPWAERSLVPYGGAGSQVFLDTAEDAFESGQRVAGLAAYLARAGVRYVVVRNDLSPASLGYTPPRLVHQTLALSGFSRVTSFGPLVTGAQTNPGTILQVQAYLPQYPAVEVYQAASPALRPSAPVAALPVSRTVLVNGGPDSLLQLEGQGIVARQPAVIASDPMAGRPLLWAVTDGQRRADNSFGLINANTSFSYTAVQTNPPDDPLGGTGGPPRQILPVPAAGHQTVAVLSGAASVTASSYGSWLTQQPQYDPVNAFDGNSVTAWAEGDPSTPIGQWIQITFDRPLSLPDHIGVQLLDRGVNRSVANQLQVSTAAGRVTTTTAPTNATQLLRVRPGRTRWLRITITGASNVIPGDPGAGLRDVLIPGVRVTRYLRPPQAAAGLTASTVAFSFHQAAPAPAGTANRGATTPFARLFTLPAPLRLEMTAAAVAQPGPGLAALLGRLAPPGKSDLLVTASSTWGSLPVFGPDNLLRPGRTPWIAGAPNPVISLGWQGLRRISRIVVQPAFGFAAAPSRIRVSSVFGTRQATIGLGGVATLTPPLTTDQLNISFPGWGSAPAPGAPPGQPVLGLAKLTIPALSGLHVGVPDPGARFSLACGQGPAVNLDGRSYRTAVSGTLGDLARTLPVQVRLCTPGTGVNLGSGQHRLLVQPGVFTMTDVTLRSEIAGATQAQAPAARPALARALTVLSWRPDRRQVRIGPGQAAYVEVHQNANPGWRATLDGRRLAPARLDGWQQAYLVPAGAGGVITMTFAPATLYHAGLAGSALAVLILLGAALPWKRRRRAAAAGPPDDGPAAGPAGPTNGAPAGEAGAAGATGRADGAANGPAVSTTAPPANGTPADALGPRHAAGAMRGGSGLRPWAGPLAVAGLIVAVGGPVALAVPVLAVIALLRPRALPAISLAAMLAAGAIAATAVAPAATGSGAFGPAAQVLALVALAAALYPAGAGAPDARDGWRPSRPLPGLGRRLMLPPGPGGQPEPPAGQAGPLSIGGPR
ncbi:MAG TPA: alpha-(1-_3)-arabinofuranosyltransferase family protein [Streptosporangiaceae bacterium]